MKHLLSTLPLLLAAGALVLFIAGLAVGCSLLTPNVLGLGAGLVTCAGLCAMTESDARASRRLG